MATMVRERLNRSPWWGLAQRPVHACAGACVPACSPPISIIIPAFNEARYIRGTLESVARAAALYSGSTEVIVVDNHSTDATAEIAGSLGATVVYEPVNQIARARNSGAAAATARYLVFLDADTTLEGDILTKVATNLSTGWAIGGGAWTEPDCGPFSRLMFRILFNYLPALKGMTVGPFLYCDRAAFQRAGGFDEELFAGEEFSLARRLRAEGRKNQRTWKIIRYDRRHRVVTSSRNLGRWGGLEMAAHNAHLIWRPHARLRQKSCCEFWYRARRDE